MGRSALQRGNSSPQKSARDSGGGGVSRAARRVNRAIQITPPSERERYAREWHGDLDAAADLGIAPMQIARGARRIAWRLRGRRWAMTLSGKRGGVRAAVAWISVLASLPVLFLVGGFLAPLVVPGAIVVALSVAPRGQSRAAWVVMLAASLLWTVCTVVYWWLWGVGFDAAEAFQPEPSIMRWAEPSFVVGACGFLTFWVAFVASAIQVSRHHRTVTSHTQVHDSST